jgi:hypothetical protein
MRRYLDDDQPQNFGQFLGRTLAGTIAPHLENRRQQGILDAQTAQEQGFKQQGFLADEDYRRSTLGETRRHNLAMEGKEKAATPYHPATIEAAIIDVDRDPNLSPEKKIQIKTELTRLHQSLQKPTKEPVDPNLPSSYPQVRETAKDFQGAVLSRLEPRLRTGLLSIGTDKGGQFDPYKYSSQGLSGMNMPDLVSAGTQYRQYLNPEAQAALDSSVVAQGTPPVDLMRKWGGQQGGYGPDGSFNSEEEWQQAKREMGL